MDSSHQRATQMTMPNEAEPTFAMPSWEQLRLMQHVMRQEMLPDPADGSRLSTDPLFDRIDPRHRERARYFHAFGSVFAELGVMPAELRMPFEPLHPLPAGDLASFVDATLTSLGATPPHKAYGLAAISRALVVSYNPAADLFPRLDGAPKNQNLFLYDPVVGFVIWSDGQRVRNAWFGNQRDIQEVESQGEPLRGLLLRSQSDHFSIGKSLFMRLIGPLLPRPRSVRFDDANIPTIAVETQADLEALADEIQEACRRSPLNVTAVFRGQSTEHRLPDRTPLVSTGICPYSDIADHSLIPSLYRHYDEYLDRPEDFRAFASHLLDWSLYADLIFGDPAEYRTLDGQPYTRKTVPANAQAIMTLAFSGEATKQRVTEDLGPYTTWKITAPDGTVLDEYIKRFRPGHDTVRRNLLLQHYGAPTPFIDVTRDIRVAEWFSLNLITVGEKGLSTSGHVDPPFQQSVIYVLLALDGLTPLINTEELVRPEESLRPHRQACALMGGPGNLYRNAVSRFIGLKIKFAEGFVPKGLPTAEYLFPGPAEDNTLKSLLEKYHVPAIGPPLFPVYWFPTR